MSIYLSAVVSAAAQQQQQPRRSAPDAPPSVSVPYVEPNTAVAGEGFSGFIKRKFRRLINGQCLIEFNRESTEQSLLSGSSELKAPVTETVTPSKPTVGPDV